MRALGPVVLLAGLAACAGRPVPLGDVAAAGRATEAGPTLAAKACGSQWLFLPPVAMTGRYARAYADLRTQARGRVLTDVAVDEQVISLFFGAVICTKLEARALRPAPAAAVTDAHSAGLPARPAAAFAAGQRAHIAAGATARIRATPDAGSAPGIGAGDAVTLKAPMRNTSGAWWYVTAAGKGGWVREADLEPVAR